MNRILFREEEIDAASGCVRIAGDRARHIRDVLHAAEGDALRLGLLGGARYDGARLVHWETSGGGEAALVALGDPDPALPRAPVDLLLALPRPKCMRRLWAQIAAMGVGRVYLTAAEKVEKSYWGSTFLNPAEYEPLLEEGLAQAGDTIAPRIELHRRLKPLVEDVLPARYAPALRVLAHPPRRDPSPDSPAPVPPRASAAELGATPDAPLLLCIGPEGGWTPYEVALFEANGFRRYSLGDRILRTDTAVVSALARLTQS